MKWGLFLAKLLLSLVTLAAWAIMPACQGASTATPTQTPRPLTQTPTIQATVPLSTPTPTPRPPTQTPVIQATATPSSSPSQAVTLNLSAQNLSFDKNTLTVPARAKVTVIFSNKEGIPHNLAVYETQAATKVIFQGETISGPATIEYSFTAPDTPGIYFFRCDIHPLTMTGSFVVTG